MIPHSLLSDAARLPVRQGVSAGPLEPLVHEGKEGLLVLDSFVVELLQEVQPVHLGAPVDFGNDWL